MRPQRIRSNGEPTDHRDVHRRNLSLVLRAVSRLTEVSRAKLADSTALTKPTISTLVDELMKLGLLIERGPDESGRVGRPGRLLSLNGDSVVGLGLEINVDYVAVCVMDLVGAVRYNRVIRLDNREQPPERALDTAARLGNKALKWTAQHGVVASGVTLAVPALVDVHEGRLVLAPNLGWKDLPVVEMLTSRLQGAPLSIHVDNEANLGALGELRQGLGADLGDFVHISGEIGVGAGLIFDGALWCGYEGLAGEFGHMQIDRNGPLCPCGSRGCLERYVGQEALLVAAGVESKVETIIGTSSGGSVTELISRARSGDSRTLNALAQAGDIIGGACVTVANLLDPATIVLGGIYAPLAPWIAEPIRVQLARRNYVHPPEVLTSDLGTDAAVRGAASWALDHIMADPMLMAQNETTSATAQPRRRPTGVR